MKKIKILLPIIGIGATAAAVTPMLVSCGKGESFTITGDEIYVPTVKAAKAELKSKSNANDMYFRLHAKENPDVFVQDIASDLSRKIYTIVHESPVVRNDTNDEKLRDIKIKYSMSNLSFDTFTATDEGEHTAGKVSYTLKGSIFMDCRKFPLLVDTKQTQNEAKTWYLSYLDLESIEVTMKNGAFFVDTPNPTDFPHSWTLWFKTNPTFLGQISNWSVDIKVKGKYIGTQQFEVFNYDDHFHYDPTNPLPIEEDIGTFAEEYLWATYDKLFGTIDYSYHLQNVHVNIN